MDIANLQRLRDEARRRLEKALEREQETGARFQDNPEAYEEWQRDKKAFDKALADFNAANDDYLNAARKSR